MNIRLGPGVLPASAITAVAAIVGDSAVAQTAGSLTLIPNPTPEVGDLFGFRLALVGDDAVLIGAPGDDTAATNGGIAYLFSLDGSLLHTFLSPDPRENENFGVLVTAVGDDRVLITAIQGDEKMAPDLAGAAYLFDLDGILLETFQNPNPSVGDGFGVSAPLPDGTLMIGSFGDDADAENAGRVYQYQPGGNGEPLETFSDPTPELDGGFGFPVTALGADRFTVGVSGANGGAGEVHVFNHLTGAHVTAIAHPDQTFELVNSTAALGSDVVVVGSESFNVNGEDSAGGVFLFDAANGGLLLTIPNPAPEFDDAFGIFVDTIGAGRIVIGADLDNPNGINNAGTVYVYDSSGNLLETISNPTPEADDQFGFALSASAAGVLAIGSPQGEFDFAAGAGQVYIASGLCPADITAAEVTFGSNQGPQDPGKLTADDDDRTIASSRVFLSALEPNLAVLQVAADLSACLGPNATVTIDVQDHASQPNVTVRVRLRPPGGGSPVQVGQYGATFNVDSDHQIVVTEANQFIDGNGGIVLELRYSTIALLSPLGFDGRTDLVSFSLQ